MPEQIVVAELADAWATHKERLDRRRARITQAQAVSPGSADGKEEIAEIDQRISRHEVDPLMTAIWPRLGLGSKPPRDGIFNSQRTTKGGTDELPEGELRAAAIHWGLSRAGHTDDSATESFERDFNQCDDRFERDKQRYAAICKRLIAIDPCVRWSVVEAVREELIARGVKLITDALIDDARKACEDKPVRCEPPVFALHDMTEHAGFDIVGDHLRSAAVIFAYDSLDRGSLYRAAEGVVELADRGEIPISCDAEELIEEWRIKSATEWPLEARIAGLTEHVLDEQFWTLLRAVVVAGRRLTARLTQNDLVGSFIPVSISTEPLRSAAAELAAYASMSCRGTASAAAAGLHDKTIVARRLVSDRSIAHARCALDWRGVIAGFSDGLDATDAVHAFERAEHGATVLLWLAEKARILAGREWAPLLELGSVAADVPAADADKPTAAGFLRACEQLYELMRDEMDEPVDEEAEEEEVEVPEAVDEEDDEDVAVAVPARTRASRPRTVSQVQLQPSHFVNGFNS